MILRLTDGTTTVTLSGTGGTIVGAIYVPRTPDEEAQRYIHVGRDGQSVGEVRLLNVVESALVTLSGSAANIRTEHQTITRLLQRARAKVARCWVEYDPTGGGTPWRAEVFAGKVSWPDERHLRRLTETTNDVQVTVLWEREPAWMPATWTELPISALSQAANTGGRTITNHNDADAGNWFEVAANQVAGDLPGPVQITLQNTSGGSVFYRNFYFGVRAYLAGAFTHIIEGEDAQSGDVVESAGSSNGEYISLDFTGSGTLIWDLPATDVQAAGGKRYKLLMHSAGAPGNIYVTPQLRDLNGLTILWEGDRVFLPAAESELIDLGRALPLPPAGAGAWGDMTLAFFLEADGAATFRCDYIQLTPTHSYSHPIQRATTVGNNSLITYDSEINQMYWVAVSGRMDVYAVDELRLTLEPGYINRIYLLFDRQTGTSDIDDSFTVRLYHKPRRITV